MVRTICHACAEAKMTKTLNKGPVDRATERLELVHSDVKGPFPVPSIVGSYFYFIIFVDDLTRFTWIFPLRTTRSEEVIPTFKWFKDEVEIFTGSRIRCFRCDNNRGEYTNKDFQKFLKESHIEFVPSVPYHQHQNGISERAMRTVSLCSLTLTFLLTFGMRLWQRLRTLRIFLQPPLFKAKLPPKHGRTLNPQFHI